MGLIGATFQIESGRFRQAPLRQANGRPCRLVAHHEQSLYVTDIEMPEEGDDGEFIVDGRLIVCAVSDGRVLKRTSRTRLRKQLS